MILAVDTDVLVPWALQGSPRHRLVRRFLERQIQEHKQKLGLTHQILYEFIHVATDHRRFENPMPMIDALDLAQELWASDDVVGLEVSPLVIPTMCAWMRKWRLGRKRILDTALAATLESSGVSRLATFNGKHFKIFDFLEIVEPGVD